MTSSCGPYHQEALRRQRVVDKKRAALERIKVMKVSYIHAEVISLSIRMELVESKQEQLNETTKIFDSLFLNHLGCQDQPCKIKSLFTFIKHCYSTEF